MQWYESDVRALEAARANRPPVPNPVVFYGSSTLRLWTTMASDLANPRALNLGFGGSTLAACVHFFERLVVPEHPSAVILYAGDNDLGDGGSPDEVASLFSSFTRKLESELGSLPFAFISIKPSPARANILDRIRRANSLIESQISRIAHAFYIDIFDSMLGPDESVRPDLFQPDGLHLNTAGYQLWTKLLLPYRHQIFTSSSYLVQAGAVPLSKE